MAELTAAQQRILEAKRRAAEKRGEVFDPEKEAADKAAKAAAKVEVKAAAEVKVEAPVVAEAKVEVDAPVVAKAEAPVKADAAPAADRIAAAKASAAAKRPAAPAGGDTPAPKPVSRPAMTAGPAGSQTAEEPAGQSGINRREFLTYAWGAALGLIAAQGGYATYDFLYPRFKAGEFGGKFILGAASSMPTVGTPPEARVDGKFWLVQTDEGIKAIYMVCTHLGCLYKWEASNTRFECPCHGSKFTAEGIYIEGPAPRSLDQFSVEVLENDVIVSQTTDTPEAIVPAALPSPGAVVVVNTGKKILGHSHS